MGIEVVPYQDDGAAELLVGGVQQPGEVRLSEAFALIVAAPAVLMHAVDQPGAAPGLDGD
jgi:hypothetical protein